MALQNLIISRSSSRYKRLYWFCMLTNLVQPLRSALHDCQSTHYDKITYGVPELHEGELIRPHAAGADVVDLCTSAF